MLDRFGTLEGATIRCFAMGLSSPSSATLATMLLVVTVLAIYDSALKNRTKVAMVSADSSLPLPHRHIAQALVRKSLEAKVAKWKSVVFSDLNQLENAVSVNLKRSKPLDVAGGKSDASTNIAPASTATRAHDLLSISSKDEGIQSLDNQHHELERWEAALQQQMVLQCLSSARQHAPADRAAATRRCEARITRRARSSLRTFGVDPALFGATGRRGARRSTSSRGFTQLRNYKPTGIDQVHRGTVVELVNTRASRIPVPPSQPALFPATIAHDAVIEQGAQHTPLWSEKGVGFGDLCQSAGRLGCPRAQGVLGTPPEAQGVFRHGGVGRRRGGSKWGW